MWLDGGLCLTTCENLQPTIYVLESSALVAYIKIHPKGHFTHETESPWPLHFKHSHWWKRQTYSKFALHYGWGTNGVCECKMDVKSTWHRMDHVSWSLGLLSKPPLGGRPNTKPWHSNRSQALVYSILSYFRTQMKTKSLKWHLVEDPTAYDFTLQ